MHETASESKAPGGGSVSAAMGAMGAALSTMVANLSSHKRGWTTLGGVLRLGRKRQGLSRRTAPLSGRGYQRLQSNSSCLASAELYPGREDRPKEAIQEATKGAILIPFRVMEVALKSMEVAQGMAEVGWQPQPPTPA